jgi:cell division transport system permease protein
MTYLSLIAVVVGLALAGVTNTWTTGLENRATVEIPAPVVDELDNPGDRIAKLITAIRDHNAVMQAKRLTDDEVAELIAPWLGSGAVLDQLPLPVLIDVQLSPERNRDKNRLTGLQDQISEILPGANLDDHGAWLADVIRLARLLQMIIGGLAIVILLISLSAIIGAARAKLDIHADEVRLLHIMGASDYYIAHQFARNMAITGFKGGVYGLIAGVISLGIIWVALKQTDYMIGAQLPDNPYYYLALLITPIITALIAGLSTRLTVLSHLRKQP